MIFVLSSALTLLCALAGFTQEANTGQDQIRQSWQDHVVAALHHVQGDYGCRDCPGGGIDADGRERLGRPLRQMVNIHKND